MALIKCKHCGGLLSTLAEKCPHCGAPVDKDPQQPVEAPPVAAVDKPQPVPETCRKDAPEYDEEESHTGRNVTLLVLFLILVAAGGYYFHLKSGSQSDDAIESWLKNENFADTDSLQMDTAQVAEASVAEPEETLEVSSQEYNGSKQLLATYRYGDLVRKYYWNPDDYNLSICDENGKGLKRHNLVDKYGINRIPDYGESVVAKLYNHHVYFVGFAGGASWVGCTVFYLAPREGNGIYKIGSGEGEPSYEFLRNSVRLRHLTRTNEDQDVCCAEYEYEETWETIPLQ